MAGRWDANIKLLHPAREHSAVTLDMVKCGSAFDILADVEIGEELMSFGGSYEISVVIRNVTQSKTLMARKEKATLPAVEQPWDNVVRVHFGSNWTAADGDILDAFATFKFVAGTNKDYSIAHSSYFAVAA